MTLVDFDSDDVDTVETPLSELVDGGVWMAYMDFTGLADQTGTLSAYTRVNPDSELRLWDSVTLVGPAPVDPAVAALGPIVSSELIDLQAILDSGDPVSCDWRLEHRGRVRTLEGGQDTKTASGGVDTLLTVPYGGEYYLLVDAFAMQGGDTLKLRLRARGGDLSSTVRTIVYRAISGVQTELTLVGPLVAHDSVVATLEQSAGTPRAYPWQLLRVND